MEIVELEEIERVLADLDLLPLIEAGFVAYSQGRAVVPPVGELILEEGEVHIKYGFIRKEPFYVIKIASGFYRNPELGLPSGDGLMLVYEQSTGRPVAALLDRARLTDLRTAAAGAIGAKYLAPRRVERIGIVGTGIQARLQLLQLRPVTECREVCVWGRNPEHVEAYVSEMSAEGFHVVAASDPAELTDRCNLIVTTTPSSEPLLLDSQVRAGTHISAMGSDAPHKQELEADLLARADVIVADSREQCRVRGEIARAVAAGKISHEAAVELGDVIAGRFKGRTDDDQITIFDSTGVAVQDIQIATAVVKALGLVSR